MRTLMSGRRVWIFLFLTEERTVWWADRGQLHLVISDEILHTSLAGNGKDRHHQLVDSVGVTRHAVGVLVYAVDVVLREELLVMSSRES